MPVNTRKKSVSLADLGIHLPKRARAPSVTQPSPPATVIEDEPLSKKAKWSHGSTTPPPTSMSPPASTNIRVKPEPPSRLAEHTPPPSPGAASVHKIDTDGIKDDVVVGTIRQLEKTGNRPHLVKELAAVLTHNIAAVEKYVSQPRIRASIMTTTSTTTTIIPKSKTSTNPSLRSANPANLISSRLTSYLNRAWPTISPCPLAKYQSTVHPRPLYYFLTTQPHQPIPEMNQVHGSILAARRIISPSLSSADDDADAKYNRNRNHMSPSPEVDLSSPELDDDEPISEMSSSFSHRGSLPREHPPTSSNLSHNRRADSPPLEREERDFKQTANALQELRRTSQDCSMGSKSPELQDDDSVAMSVEFEPVESEESLALRNHQDAAALFAEHALSSSVSTIYDFSSPMLKPLDRQNVPDLEIKAGKGMMLASAWHADSGKQDLSTHVMIVDHKSADPEAPDVWSQWADGELRSPENIELDELECLFDF